ncbi:MAG: glycosyltransferase [Candidatus Spechtbacteria bacterium]|nr:glycosyltransferase [Candidatus Spechtbacteria bacterium]
MTPDKPLRIALVHDFLIRYGGAERVLSAMHSLFPSAPIYTLFADKKIARERFADADVRASWLQRLPLFAHRHYKYLAPLLISATEQFDFHDFDIVISSSASFTKGIITSPHTVHIWYCHTPTRFLWDFTQQYAAQTQGFAGGIGRIALHLLRTWDFEAAQRPDYIIANSNAVRARVQKFYRRDAQVIYPPVTAPRNNLLNEVDVRRGEYFLIVSYLQKYKNVDIAVEAFSKIGLPLVVIGDGPEREYLRGIAGNSITFLGAQSDAVVHEYLKECKAFVFPSDDDFGIAPVEAMLYGKPVIALRRGGVQESVMEGVHGEFFDDPDSAVLADAVRRLNKNYQNYDPEIIRRRAELFSQERFAQELRRFLRDILASKMEK